MGIVKDLWEFRDFIFASVTREINGRYRSSSLGLVWALANPLAMVLIYTVVFSEVMNARLPGVPGQFSYSIFLCAGISFWGLFSEITLRTQSMFIDNANLIKKVNFPRVCLVLITVGSSLFNFALLIFVLFLFLLLIGSLHLGHVVYLIPITSIVVLLAVSVGVFFAILTVFFRDLSHAVPVTINFLFWLTPVVYPVSSLGELGSVIAAINPVAPIIMVAQDVFLFGASSRGALLTYPILFSLFFLVITSILIRRVSGQLVDDL